MTTPESAALAMTRALLVLGWPGAVSGECALAGSAAVVAGGNSAGALGRGAETPIAVTAILPKAPATMAIPVRFSGIRASSVTPKIKRKPPVVAGGTATL